MARRVKRVYKYASEVNHIWAQGNALEATTPTRHHRCERDTLWSYATPVANFVTNSKGKRAVLITTAHYSVTTQQNMPHRSDIPGDLPVFKVLHIGATGGRSPYPSTRITKEGPSLFNYHADNMDALALTYAAKVLELEKKRSGVEYVINEARAIRGEAERYAKFFGLKFPKKSFVELTLAQVDAARARNERHEAAKREKDMREREARDAREASLYKQLLEWLAAHPEAKVLQDMPHEVSRYVRQFADRDDTLREICAESYREQIARWRRGERVDAYGSYGVDFTVFPTLLRVRGDVIETSRGASFPVSHGVKAWPLIKICKDNASRWVCNGHKIHLGEFQIDCVEADGTVKAGCHTVPFAEVERIAHELGVVV